MAHCDLFMPDAIYSSSPLRRITEYITTMARTLYMYVI